MRTAESFERATETACANNQTASATQTKRAALKQRLGIIRLAFLSLFTDAHCNAGMRTETVGAVAVNLAAEIVWQDSMGPFEYIGCRVVARLQEFPQQNDSPGQESR